MCVSKVSVTSVTLQPTALVVAKTMLKLAFTLNLKVGKDCVECKVSQCLLSY